MCWSRAVHGNRHLIQERSLGLIANISIDPGFVAARHGRRAEPGGERIARTAQANDRAAANVPCWVGHLG